MRRLVVIVLVVLALGAAAYKMTRPPKAEKAAVLAPTPVETALAALGTVVERVEVTGSIQAEDQGMLSSQVGGRVERVFVDEGDPVRRGQVLLQIDPLEYEAAVRQAEAAVRSAATRLRQAQSAAKLQETQTSTAVAQAKAGLSAAQEELEIVRKGAREQERLISRNRVAQAKAAFDNASANLNRMKKLLAAGAVSQQQVEAAQTQYDVAKADYDTARQQENLVTEGARPEEVRRAEAAVRSAQETLRLAEASTSLNLVRRQDVQTAEDALDQARSLLVQARDRLANTALRSPVDGYVTARNVDPGEVVGAGGAPLLAVARLSNVFFEALVSEIDIARVHPGQQVTTRVDALAGRVFQGRVARVVPSAQQGSRSFKVRVLLGNPGALLRPGMYARGQVRVGERYGVVVVPKDALLSEAGSTRVMKVVAGKVRVTPVVVGYADTGQVEVRRGVAPGDEVIVSGQSRVNDGDPVKAVRVDWRPDGGEGE